MKSVSTESYKGVRDFYPEDMSVQKYIFSVWKKAVESFGYVEYTASPLEPAELYEAKSGEEIANEQSYIFTDRGGRRVTLRPEMTPTVARMIAKKGRDLALPSRWYSIVNVFRYERPQRGRLREHYQLNVDMFGVGTFEADVETIALISNIMTEFGALDKDFVIKINDRRIIEALFDTLKVPANKRKDVTKIVDKKNKISESIYSDAMTDLLGDKASDVIDALSEPKKLIMILGEEHELIRELVQKIEALDKRGITNIEFTPSLMRGFDYYTGTIFEVNDTHPENPRSLFGGGRYDELLGIFGVDHVPATGFGMGDVTTKDFLETHGLLPKYRSTTDVYICKADEHVDDFAEELATELRQDGVNVAVDITGRKISAQIKTADKQGVPYIICIGEKELALGVFVLKHLETGKETPLKKDELAEAIKKTEI